MKPRIIFHMDGDAFFVACEVVKNPALRGRAVVTGEERGIVSALSYEAKALGIVRGMPIFKLKKEFPQVLVLPGDYASYARYSSAMFDIVRRYADDVEEYSIDECFAELTGLDRTLRMTCEQIAQRIKHEVTSELGLSVSVGVAPTKVLAKVASKYQKPNGLTIIEHDKISDYLSKTPIGKIWGIGTRTAIYLRGRGIETAQDFVQKGEAWVKEHMAKPYQVIWHELSGNSLMEVDPNPKNTYSSIQKTRTFYPAMSDTTFLLSQLSKHMEDACAKARHYNLVPRGISFFLKTREFRYHSHSLPLSAPTNALEILIGLMQKYFGEVYDSGSLYRTAGVGLHGLAPEEVSQRGLFGETNTAHKFETIHQQIDALEEKFGKRVVYLGSTHKARNRKVKGTDADDLDRDLLFL